MLKLKTGNASHTSIPESVVKVDKFSEDVEYPKGARVIRFEKLQVRHLYSKQIGKSKLPEH